jgi:acetoin:2,6-dichlorophenolindophenol oxidoreductase subunit alpha
MPQELIQSVLVKAANHAFSGSGSQFSLPANDMGLSHRTITQIGHYRDMVVSDRPAEVMLNLYRQVQRLRRIELAIKKEYHPADEIRCPVHFCIGQEAIPAALSMAVEPADYVFSHHRSHGYYFAKHAPIRDLFAELYGRETGASGGRAGSQDISHSSSRFFSGAILGGAASIGIGAAFGIQLQKLPEIVFLGFGEACSEEGAFWEGMELVAAKNLPVVFICENNRYSTFSDQNKRLGRDNLSEKVGTFGIPAVQIFGNDAPLAFRTILKASDNARRGGGPTFIEAFTYRLSSHVGPEDDNVNNYRAPGEVEFWLDNCPVRLLAEKLIEAGILTAELDGEIKAEQEKEIAGYFAYAKGSAFPKVTNWKDMNICSASSVADRLLVPEEANAFDHNQADTKITSY